jgi:hypothetical protein
MRRSSVWPRIATTTAVLSPLKLKSSPGRKVEHAVAAFFGEHRERRPAGIAQAEQFGGLVEGFPRRVVLGFAENAVPTDTRYLDQHGVAARHLQRHEREVRGSVLECRGEQMALQMMHADHRNTPGIAQRTGNGGADEQRSDQARTRGIGNPFNGLRIEAGLGQGSFDHRQQPLDVVARRKFRHHAPVRGMQRHLAENLIREQAPGAVIDGDRSLVAGGFNAKYVHKLGF